MVGGLALLVNRLKELDPDCQILEVCGKSHFDETMENLLTPRMSIPSVAGRVGQPLAPPTSGPKPLAESTSSIRKLPIALPETSGEKKPSGHLTSKRALTRMNKGKNARKMIANREKAEENEKASAQ
jgi:hypothetical protein